MDRRLLTERSPVGPWSESPPARPTQGPALGPGGRRWGGDRLGIVSGGAIWAGPGPARTGCGSRRRPPATTRTRSSTCSIVDERQIQDVAIEPTRRVRVGAGVKWDGSSRSSPSSGWPRCTARRLTSASPAAGWAAGWAGSQIRPPDHQRPAIELVTADGRAARVDAENEPELFWALRGGNGNFGLVTAIEFALYPVANLYADLPLLRDPARAGHGRRARRRRHLSRAREGTTSARPRSTGSSPRTAGSGATTSSSSRSGSARHTAGARSPSASGSSPPRSRPATRSTTFSSIPAVTNDPCSARLMAARCRGSRLPFHVQPFKRAAALSVSMHLSTETRPATEATRSRFRLRLSGKGQAVSNLQ